MIERTLELLKLLAQIILVVTIVTGLSMGAIWLVLRVPKDEIEED